MANQIPNKMEGFNYYRIKTSWQGEADDGNLVKLKTEELVYACSYTEAESIAYALIEQENRARFSTPTFEIIKTKIDELVFNDTLVTDGSLTKGLVNCYFAETDETGVGLYGVKVMFIQLDERSGKEKRSHTTIHVPAKSNADASAIVSRYLQSSPKRGDFVVRDAKFDATSAIFWPSEFYKQISSNKVV